MVSGKTARRCGIALLTLASFVSNAEAGDCPKVLRIAYPDYSVPPYFLGTGEAVPDDAGLAISWARQALRDSGCKTELQFFRRPVPRAVFGLTHGEFDFALGNVPAARPDLVRYPMRNGEINSRLALVSEQISLFAFHLPVAGWDGKTGRPPTGVKVGIVRASMQMTAAQAAGFEVEEAINPSVNIQKLLKGRLLLIAELDRTVADTLARESLPPLIRLDALRTVHYYAPASTDFYQRHADFVSAYWLAMCNASRAALPGNPCVP